jgi:hypothetical protein
MCHLQIVMVQIPMRIVLSLSTPVVFHEDLTLAWDKYVLPPIVTLSGLGGRIPAAPFAKVLTC